MAMQRGSDVGREERESGAAGQGMAEQAKSEAGQAAEQTKEEARRLSEQAREQIASRAEQQKTQAMERLEGIGTALHETSSTLHDRNEDSVANVIDGAARQAERLADYLRHRSVNDMVAEVEDYARREPEMFLGGAALLGLIGARFFMSSSPEGRRRSREMYRGTPRGEYVPRDEHAARRGPPRREERDRPTVAGTSAAEMPDPARTEESGSEAGPA